MFGIHLSDHGTDVFLAILGIAVGLSVPWLDEWVLKPYKFRRDRGIQIAGTYFSVWHTATKTPHDTWEQAEIKQRGSKIEYLTILNDDGFKYRFVGEVRGPFVSGDWCSMKPQETIGGGATLYSTPQGHMAGFWIGDCKVNNITWGYWAISKDKRALETFVHNMEHGLGFKTTDIGRMFDEHYLATLLKTEPRLSATPPRS